MIVVIRVKNICNNDFCHKSNFTGMLEQLLPLELDFRNITLWAVIGYSVIINMLRVGSPANQSQGCPIGGVCHKSNFAGTPLQ